MNSIDPQPADALLSLRLLGPYQAYIGDQPLSLRHSRKEQWLLALLALRHGLSVERAWLADTLWPESRNSRALLRDTLFDLRRSLGPHARRIGTPTSHTLCLSLDEAEADILRFDAAIARGDLVSLEAAVALYRGPLLEGCAEEWVLVEREVREQAYLSARERLALHALESGDPATAASHLRQVIVVEPLRENAQRTLMQALAAQGESAAVTQVYRNLRLLLHRELHAEPAESTQALYQQIQIETRSHARSQSLLLPLTLERRARRLPTRLTRFFGREEEIARLQALLSPAFSPRLITMTGAGGSGKTRLALETAESLQEAWAGGLWFVPLASLSDTLLIPGAILEAMSLARSPNAEPLEQVVGFLNGVGRPIMLILDNYEHLLAKDHRDSTDGARIARTLLERIPTLTLLVTSRQVLNLEGEQEFSVLPLPIPNCGKPQTPERLMQCAGVQLFVDRAQAVKADFHVTAANAEAIAALCDRLEGIPLALELAAARARIVTPSQMLSALERRFDFLVSHKRDTAERHRTLRATLDWSYRLLPAEMQRFFVRLCVFRGGWTLETAEAVCGPSSVLDSLMYLQECSLILEEERSGETRFRMLETLREYGWEQMAPAERQSVQRHHARYYLGLAAIEAPRATPEAYRSWLDRLEQELDNFRAAMEWGLETGGEIEVAAQLAWHLFNFWEARNHSESVQWVERVIAQGERVLPLERQAHLLRRAGHSAKAQDDRKAILLYERSAHIFHDLGQVEACLNCRYLALRTKGDLEEMQMVADQLNLMRRARGGEETHIDLEREFHIARGSCDFARMRELGEKRLRILQEQGNWHEEAITFHILGNSAYELGDLAATRAYCERALPPLRILGDMPQIFTVLDTLGEMACQEGNYPEALEFLRESLAIKCELQNEREIIRTLDSFAYLALAQGRHKRAACLYGATTTLRNAGRWHVFPSEERRREQRIAGIRKALGENAFLAAWESGPELTKEQAIAYVLREG